MSRDLEREYRGLVNSDVPDLWTRIEAGLEEKNTAPGEAKTDIRMTDFQASGSRVENVRGKRARFRIWAGIAAACACVALIVPAMAGYVRTREGGSDNTASDYMAQNVVPQAGEASGAAESVRMEAAACEQDGSAAENGMDKSAVTSDDAAADNSGMAEAAAETSELYSFRAAVEILDADESPDSGIVYTARVITTDDPKLQADSEIRILSPLAPSADAAVLENGQTYELMLSGPHSEDPGQEVTYLLVSE